MKKKQKHAPVTEPATQESGPVQINLPFEHERLSTISKLAESNLLLAKALNVSPNFLISHCTFTSDGKVPAMQIGK